MLLLLSFLVVVVFTAVVAGGSDGGCGFVCLSVCLLAFLNDKKKAQPVSHYSE